MVHKLSFVSVLSFVQMSVWFRKPRWAKALVGNRAVRDLETWQRSSPFPESHLLENSLRGGNPHIETRVVEDELVVPCRGGAHVGCSYPGNSCLLR